MLLKTLPMILRKDLARQILKLKDHLHKVKIKKVFGSMTRRLSGKIMAEFVGLGQKHILTEQMIVAMIRKLKEQKLCHKRKTYI